MRGYLRRFTGELAYSTVVNSLRCPGSLVTACGRLGCIGSTSRSVSNSARGKECSGWSACQPGKAISLRIRTVRAAGRCECLSECGRGTHTGRCPNLNGQPAYGAGSRVSLAWTVPRATCGGKGASALLRRGLTWWWLAWDGAPATSSRS